MYCAKPFIEEAAIALWLQDQGKVVEPSSRLENIAQDIDFWVDGQPYSVKTQHKGLNFGDISFELYSQKGAELYTGDLSLSTGIQPRYPNGLPWFLGWYTASQVPSNLVYLIYQKKQDREHVTFVPRLEVQRSRFYKILSLSPGVYKSQGNKDTISGYHKIGSIGTLCYLNLDPYRVAAEACFSWTETTNKALERYSHGR